jgi:hypothetical protein
MHWLVSWAGFAGAWLLFAGPIYQAALELTGERFEVEELDDVRSQPGPQQVSRWWWLVPPVWFWKQHRASEQYRRETLSGLSATAVRSLVDYLGAASAWLFVGLGGLLIAVKETGELVEHYEWETWVFWLLLVVLSACSVGNASYRIERSRRIVATAEQQA